MNTDVRRIKCVIPADVGEGTAVDLNLVTAMNIPEELIPAMTPVIVARQSSALLGKVIDDTVSISGNVLSIDEGATGFAAGDIYYIDLMQGTIISATATVRASS
ncbi:MAG: hypothetical protein A2017_06580 [Lentisphaerae bacterium GWF2_44_16]|nr:MAG: hypothetical protein A2017_06580 [Lentisphaerae bacterium GWF2_44_16]